MVEKQVNLKCKDYESRCYVLEAKCREYDAKLRDNEEVVSFLQGRVDSLTDTVHRMEAELDHQQQYSRRESLRIANPIPEQRGENTDALVVKIARDVMGIPLSENEIARSHRVGKPKRNGKPRPIIVKFVSHKVKEKVYRAKDRIAMSGDYGKGFFVNEDLTKTRFGILKSARELWKAKLISEFWTRDGNIFVRDFHAKVKVFTDPAMFSEWSDDLKKNPPASYAKVARYNRAGGDRMQ